MRKMNMKYADTVLLNGTVYTADEKNTKAEAIAIADGKIQYVGDSSNAEQYIGVGTQVIELDGRMVIPGMIDSHLHPPGTAMSELFSINLSWLAHKESLLELIKGYIEENSDLPVYFGRGWSISAFDGREKVLGPGKDSLDRICLKKPVILQSYDGHSMWVNSKALELAGINLSTPDPEGGSIVRDPNSGEAWGTLKGAACELLPKLEFTKKQLREGFLAFQEMMHSLGYTGYFSAGSDLDMYSLMPEIDASGKLKLWANDSVRIDIRKSESLDAQIKRLIDIHNCCRSKYYRVSAAKIFIDGVVESGTAMLLEPYEEKLGKGHDHYGVYYWDDMIILSETISELNKAGIQVHLHTIGDRAARDSLDAFQLALNEAPGDYRNVMTHLQLVSEDDMPRFKALNVIANVQVYWHFKEPGWWEEIDLSFLGERAEKEYPLRSLRDAGATITASSDYSVVDYPNPIWAMKVGVTRNLSNAQYYDVEDIKSVDDQKWLLNKDERVSIEDMIRSFTINNAYSLFIDHYTGSLESGKQADLVVLSDNLLEIDPLSIDQVTIVKTMFNGEFVYEK